ncbi:MAG: hypothetical protein ABIH34_07745 [Nanoarchaeota archaeon]
MRIRASNTLLFLIAVVFFLTSIINLVMLWKALPEVSTGMASQNEGFVLLCISNNITILDQSFTAYEYQPFYSALIIDNPDNRDLHCFDNASFFDIHKSCVLEFTPQFDDVGTHEVMFWSNEINAFCNPHNTSRVINITIVRISKVSNLTIWDETDPEGGGQTVFANENITFWANYTANAWNASINGSGSSCTLIHNDTGAPSIPVNMTFNTTLLLYIYTTEFSSPGEKQWNVTCQAPILNFSTLMVSDNLTVTNRPPVLISDMPNETWYMDTTLSGRDLDDYFVDPDWDPITFNHTPLTSIFIDIDSITHIITYVPLPGWFGSRTMRFRASDPSGATTESNLINLTVLYREPPPPQQTPQGASGGASGGTPPSICFPQWDCSDWEQCLPAGLQHRTCKDFLECHSNFNKPNETQECTYIPTCSDLIRNQNETGVDCGGPCPPCPTCDDGIQNGGEEDIDCGGLCYPCGTCNNSIKDCHDGSCETDVDCGGPCAPCPSCSDGIQNQDETDVDCGGQICKICQTCDDDIQNGKELGVDCGGDCRPCLRLEIPGGITRSLIPFILIIILLLLLMTYLTFRFHRNVHAFKTWLFSRMLRVQRRMGIVEKPVPALIRLRVINMAHLKHLRSALVTGKEPGIAKSLDAAFMSFVKQLVHVKDAVTIEELRTLIKKSKLNAMKRTMLLSYITRLETLKYSGYKISKPALNLLIHDAEEVIDASTPKVTASQETAVLKSPAVQQVERLLAKMQSERKETSYKAATSQYREVQKAYAKLSSHEKHQVYSKISAEYQELLNAMKKYKPK